jgi:pantoate--beta-alanine ligase
MSPTIIRDVAGLRAHVAELRAQGKSIGMVPTMGALHEGHLSLVKAAKADGHAVVVSIFVNPTQFNDPKDLEKYPRTEEADVALLETLDTEVVYAPNAREMYADGFATKVHVNGVADGLCGAARPGHFDGVATVVSKLLLQCLPDQAYFGEKDFQQLAVIKRMVADLNIPVDIVGCPIMREPDGLAMSSRNVRLSAEGRANSVALIEALNSAATAIENGAEISKALEDARTHILAHGFEKIDYLELRSVDNLTPLDRLDRPARLFVAAFIDDVRLIDNVEVRPS